MSAHCDQLAPFVDGELTPAEADAFRAHLATCDACASELHADLMLLAVEDGAEPARRQSGVRPAPVVPIRSARRWSSRALAPVAFAAAAAIALWVGRAPRDPDAVASADVPPYSIVINGGDQATRGDDTPAKGGLVVVRRDSSLELVLRPSKPVTGVTARGFLVQGTEARAWSPSLDVSSDGAIRASGSAGDLLGVPSGTWDAVLVVGRADTLPSDPRTVLQAMADRATPHPWQLLVAPIRLVDKP